MENLKNFPGLFLVGSSYRGIGIPDCIQSGNQAAESTLEFLKSKSHG
jgi:oxygen-dependent protoporphyrinogen oxidase